METTRIEIQAKQDTGYGKHEYDLLDAKGEYVGLLLGTETRKGIIWEIQEYTKAGNIGAILRIPATNLLGALVEARQFLIR